MSRLTRAAAVAAALLPAAAMSAAPAHADSPAHRRAVSALRTVQDVMAGRSQADLSAALHRLQVTRGALTTPGGRAAAARFFKRPTEDGEPGGDDVVYQVEEETPYPSEGGHFLIHYVASTDDAPDLTDSDADGAPDYVERMADVFDDAYVRENGPIASGGLGWREPVSDDGLGGDDRLDVYIADLTQQNAEGYVAVDDGQDAAPHQHAFMVMRKSYDTSQSPTIMEATVYHEYAHVLQNAYDANLDSWLFESTATWIEDVVLPDDNNYLSYINGDKDVFNALGVQQLPITSDKASKKYGLATLIHFLERHYGKDVVRQFFEQAAVNADSGTDPDGNPHYDLALIPIAQVLKTFGTDIPSVFDRFSAAQAEWKLSTGPFVDGKLYEDIIRQAPFFEVGDQIDAVLDHLTSQFFDVRNAGAGGVTFQAKPPAGRPIAVAIVGRTGDPVTGSATTVIGQVDPANGMASAALPAGNYSRVTAVLINHGTANGNFDESKLEWTFADDSVPVASRLIRTPVPAATPTPTPAPPAPTPAAPAPTATPIPPAPALTLGVALKVGKVKAVKGTTLAKGLKYDITVNRQAKFTVKLTIGKSGAKKLKLGKKPYNKEFTLLSAGNELTGKRSYVDKFSKKIARLLKTGKLNGQKLKLTITASAPSDGSKAKPFTETLTIKK